MASAYFTKPLDETLLINTLYRIVYQKEGEILREILTERHALAIRELRKKQQDFLQ